MIFNDEERRSLADIMERKGSERLAIMADPTVPDPLRRVIVSQLELDVGRCALMIGLADDDLSGIRSVHGSFMDSPAFLPPEAYDGYISLMDPDAHESEGMFIFSMTYMMGYIGHIDAGIAIADALLQGSTLMDGTGISRLRSMVQVMERSEDYCRGTGDGAGVDYDGAMEYISTTLDECRILLRMASDKMVPVSEVSDHLCLADDVDPEPFMSIVYPELSMEDRKRIDDHEVDWESRVAMMLGRCIADHELLSCCIRDSIPSD